ncbi:hypothetical protein [Pseudoglutamicibacter albus]|uniref:hypothetical protein n=1 Tax=Pseudoglutamicibacter albus TaxID=98671 RepID=UPI000691A633|nr:hypothetical protein [Pseudoglutamicibacter albus]
MATFVDPVDAAEASEGLRGLAHATRAFEDPADTYRVLGEVSGSVRLLRQVLDQLSRAHADHRDIAFTDDRVLIDVEGVQAGIAHLAQWDFGDETTGAAFVNGEVYDELPAGQWDRTFEADGYVLTYNPQMGYVGLVREHPDTTPTPGEEEVVAARDAFSGITSESPRRAAEGTDWFAPKVGGGAASSSVGRSL